MKPLVIAYHLVWTGYGWWLPNDPRGSGSHEVRSSIQTELGDLHHGRKRVQPGGRVVRKFQEAADDLLEHPRLLFDDDAVQSIAAAFAEVIADLRYTCYAAVIMPDHVHVLIRKHKHQGEEMMENLQLQSRQRLIDSGGCAVTHPVWSAGGWKGFWIIRAKFRGRWRTLNAIPIRLENLARRGHSFKNMTAGLYIRGIVRIRPTSKHSRRWGGILAGMLWIDCVWMFFSREPVSAKPRAA